jgi:hypothetical protein
VPDGQRVPVGLESDPTKGAERPALGSGVCRARYRAHIGGRGDGVGRTHAPGKCRGIRALVGMDWRPVGGWVRLGTVYAAPKLGAGLFMASIVTAELLTGLLLDHFGLLGYDVHHARWGRLVGGALMIAGLSLIAIF